MRRQLGIAFVLGLFGVLTLADVSEACHHRRRGCGCAQQVTCAPVVQTCYQPCAQPRGCGHRRGLCGGGGGLFHHGGRRVVVSGPSCGGCSGGGYAYGGGYGMGHGGYGTAMPTGQGATGQMMRAY